MSFMAIAIFSFVMMMHGSNGEMSGDCPFSVMGASLCPQNTVAIAIHHISAYTSFINVPVNAGITAYLIILLLSIVFIFTIPISPPLLRVPAITGYLDYFSIPKHRSQEMPRWLSLFENSPSQY